MQSRRFQGLKLLEGKILLILMEVAINFPCDGAADTVDRFQIGQSSAGDASRGAEVHE